MTEDEKRGRGRPKTIDREKTIYAAMTTYWEEGPSALSINELCRRIHISKPGLYREFGGIDGLMEAVLDKYRELVLVPLFYNVFAPERSFQDLLETLPELLTAQNGGPSGCLFTKMRSSPSVLGEATLARVHAIQQEIREVYGGWYRAALERGEVNPDLDPETAAHYLDSQIMNVMVQMAAGHDSEVIRIQARLALSSLGVR